MKWMVASVAAIALVAGAGVAQPGNGNGNGNANANRGNNGGPSAMAQGNRGGGQDGGAMRGNSGNGNGNAMRGNPGNGNGSDMRPQTPNQGNGGAMADRGNSRSNTGGPPMKAGRSSGNGNGNAGGGNGNAAMRGGPPPLVQRANGNGNSVRRDSDRVSADRVEYRGPARYIDRDYLSNHRDAGMASTLIGGCPPGLAKKNNGCQPPGQARKNGLLQRNYYDAGWWGLSNLYDGNYRYDSGYLLRLGSGGGILGYIPLLGGALSVGHDWPMGYGYTGLSPYYQNYYGLGDPRDYRYADNVVYRLDPQTSAITSIAALLTGDDFVIGQPAPRGYDIYNVPPSYRDRYYDRPDAHYRYSDGYIYQIDPETRLVAAAIELLVS